MEPPIIPIRDPVERPPVPSGAIEVLEEAMAEKDDEGMLEGVGIARAVVTIVEGVTTDKGEGGTGRVELVEADTEADTDAEVGTAGLLSEMDVADTEGGFRTTVVLVVTCGGIITVVVVGLGGKVEVSFNWRAATIPL